MLNSVSRHFLPWPKSMYENVCIFLWKNASVLPDIVVALQLSMHSLYLWFGKWAAMFTMPCMSYHFLINLLNTA